MADYVAVAPTRSLPVAGNVVAYDDTGSNGPLVLAIPGMGDLRSQYRSRMQNYTSPRRSSTIG